MVETVLTELGSLEIAINNAGVNRNHTAEDCSEVDWDTTFALNTKATFLCCQAEGRHMLHKGRSSHPLAGCICVVIERLIISSHEQHIPHLAPLHISFPEILTCHQPRIPEWP